MEDNMQFQISMERVLYNTEARLNASVKENILLQTLVSEQQEEIERLKAAVDAASNDTKEKEKGK